MGSCSSRPSHKANGSEHQQYAQMWVVPVPHVLEMTGSLQPHETLKERSLLEIWNSTMFTIFVSHQWLGFQHPDPNEERLKVLQLVLKRLIAKQLKIEYDIASSFYGRKLTARELHGIEEWYIWLDYFCVPQWVEYQVPALAEEQLLYVKSIPSYVDLCDVFVAWSRVLTKLGLLCLCGTDIRRIPEISQWKQIAFPVVTSLRPL
ncbi:unnamed protein product [Symbiodinium sp. CCMP2456]|nr:unnamed protein product [Symbiodinium sp. CCMP2456]